MMRLITSVVLFIFSLIAIFLTGGCQRADLSASLITRRAANGHIANSPAHAVQAFNPFPLRLRETVNLTTLLERPLSENVLKLFGQGSAVDPVRNRVYVSGILTPNIAVLDGSDESWIGTISTGMDYNYSLKYLHLDPVANYLYIIDNTNQKLRRVDLNSGTLVGPVDIPAGQGNAAIDTKRHRLYLTSSESPYFIAFEGVDLSRLYTTDAIGEGTGRVIYDEVADQVYVFELLKTDYVREIICLEPETGNIQKKILYRVGNARRIQYTLWDTTDQRFVISDGLFKAYVIDSKGESLQTINFPGGMEFKGMSYVTGQEQLAVLFLEKQEQNEVEASYGRLLIYDISSAQLIKEISFGRKSHHPVYNQANGKLYLPSGDASCLWSIDTRTYADPVSLRLGDSAEYVVGGADSGKIYFNSRLGGSYLVEYDTNTGTFETFTSGTWPIPMRSSQDGKYLLVLNFWESTLSVYALQPSRRLLRTISLEIPAGSTDRLPDLALDDTRQLAYAAFPEFGLVLAVNWLTGETIQLPIPGFPAGVGGDGPGGLQVIADQEREHLYVFWHSEKKLQTYNTQGVGIPVLEKEIDLTGLDWSLTRESAAEDMLFLDQEKGRLFVGPFELDLELNSPTGRVLSSGQRIFAVDHDMETYWVSGVICEDRNVQTNIVAMLDRETLEARFTSQLDPAYTGKPNYYLDLDAGLLYAAHLHSAELKIYKANRFWEMIPLPFYSDWAASFHNHPRKIWRISFNRKVDPASINDSSIFVSTDPEGLEKVDGLLLKTSDYGVELLPPRTGWIPGQDYYLFITTAVKSGEAEALSLSTPVRMLFTIDEASAR